ncbi:MAG TPA: DUF2252 domain-containing protein [Rubrivivax sp.]|nr:DUF2252 domain-containing protein [Rubrivivax sp.]HPO18839.1 DUF2252 domain-containing protein [Rubrivivax sp.]
MKKRTKDARADKSTGKVRTKAKSKSKSKDRLRAAAASVAPAAPVAAPDPVPPDAFAPPIEVAYLKKPAHLRARQERIDAGRALRVACPREAHAEYRPAANRRDVVQQLIDSSAGRIEHLVPIRYGRMARTPFTFYRGAAAVMAADLAGTPSSGQIAQACGDCHLSNFGAFATPERRVIFDINDFDETHPAPFEWDLKRLAASFVVASRNNGHKKDDAADAVREAVRAYADKLQALARMPTLSAWYESLEVDAVIDSFDDASMRKAARALRAKAEQRGADVEFVRLAQIDGGEPRIRDQPPLIYHPQQWREPDFSDQVRANLESYRRSLAPERRVLLDRYELADVAIKVVGVGSVGTTCAVVMLFAAEDDPLFLQLKEARPSVLAPHVHVQAFATEGERVVFGQRLMQASSDLFLGHLVTAAGHHAYVRQLRDMKIKATVELHTPRMLRNYARACGAALARAHARSVDPALLTGYVGSGKALSEALATFGAAYADQNERDHAALIEALRDGRLTAQFEDD